MSILLVEPPNHAVLPRAGYDRFAAASFLMSCVDYVEARSDLAGRAVVVYGVGAGAAFASQAARLDTRIRAIVCQDEAADIAQADAVVRCFIGDDRNLGDDSPDASASAAASGSTDIGASIGDVFGWIAAALR
jgi:hypothetical protein